MKKQTYLCVDLKTVMQDSLIQNRECRQGMLEKKNDDQFIFYETISETRYKRNPKLFSGQYVNLIRRKDGSYSIYLHQIKPDAENSIHTLARAIYKEIESALNCAVS